MLLVRMLMLRAAVHNGGKRLVVVRWSRAPRLGRKELALIHDRHRQAGKRKAERGQVGVVLAVVVLCLAPSASAECFVAKGLRVRKDDP